MHVNIRELKQAKLIKRITYTHIINRTIDQFYTYVLVFNIHGKETHYTLTASGMYIEVNAIPAVS